jgi:hypothetical protein
LAGLTLSGVYLAQALAAGLVLGTDGSSGLLVDLVVVVAVGKRERGAAYQSAKDR